MVALPTRSASPRRYLAKKFEFTPVEQLSFEPEYNSRTRSWEGSFVEVARGEAFMTNGGLVPTIGRICDVGVPLLLAEDVFVSRNPLPVDAYWNLLEPFSPGVWGMSVATTLALALLFWKVHAVHAGDPATRGLVKPERSPANFLLYSVAKITEPDPLPWFEAWSSGKFLVFIWSLWSLLQTMFFTSNLRAHLVSRDFETPIDTMEDVANNPGRVWIYASATQFRFENRPKVSRSKLLRQI